MEKKKDSIKSFHWSRSQEKKTRRAHARSSPSQLISYRLKRWIIVSFLRSVTSSICRLQSIVWLYSTANQNYAMIYSNQSIVISYSLDVLSHSPWLDIGNDLFILNHLTMILALNLQFVFRRCLTEHFLLWNFSFPGSSATLETNLIDFPKVTHRSRWYRLCSFTFSTCNHLTHWRSS